MFEEARQVTIPLQVLLQWDDEGNDRQLALDLFDAFGSKEKTLHANHGRAHRRPAVRGGRREPVLRPAPEVTRPSAGRRAESQWHPPPARVTLATYATQARRGRHMRAATTPRTLVRPSWSCPLATRPYLNLGIVAHVDAGKTSLTERLLYDAGVIDALGSVDAGTTRTDSMDLERRRGITIRAAVTSFDIGDLAVNLVDTPGHPDFIAEVERSLTVLDAAVLVLSAVEGVQPQTVVLWRALQRIGVPDRAVRQQGRPRRRRRRRRRRAGPPPAHRRTSSSSPGRWPRAPGTPTSCRSRWTTRPSSRRSPRSTTACSPAGSTTARSRCDRIRAALRRGTRDGDLTPLLCGSALTGVGVPLLRDLAARRSAREPASHGGPVAGTVFAVDRDERGRRAWLRLWSGEVRVRDRLRIAGAGRPVPVTEVGVSEPGGVIVRRTATAGQIVALRGPQARIGDILGRPPRRRIHRFPPATLQALVEPEDPTQRGALFAGPHRAGRRGPAHRPAPRRRRGRGRAQPARRGAEGGASPHCSRSGTASRARFSQTSTLCIERVVGIGVVEGPDRAARQPVPRRHRAARRGRARRARRRVLTRRRARQPAAGVRRGDRGGRPQRPAAGAATDGR